jgi:hypothetical protein
MARVCLVDLPILCIHQAIVRYLVCIGLTCTKPALKGMGLAAPQGNRAGGKATWGQLSRKNSPNKLRRKRKHKITNSRNGRKSQDRNKPKEWEVQSEKGEL